MPGDSPMNIGELLLRPMMVERRVLEMQTKLHGWSAADAGRCFDDLYNLVADPAFLVMAWWGGPGEQGFLNRRYRRQHRCRYRTTGRWRGTVPGAATARPEGS